MLHEIQRGHGAVVWVIVALLRWEAGDQRNSVASGGRLRDGLEFKTMFTTSSNTHAHDERTSIELFELWPSLPGPNRLWLKGRGQKDAGCCIMAEPLWIGSAGYWRNCCDTRGLGPDYTGSLWRFYPKR